MGIVYGCDHYICLFIYGVTYLGGFEKSKFSFLTSKSFCLMLSDKMQTCVSQRIMCSYIIIWGNYTKNKKFEDISIVFHLSGNHCHSIINLNLMNLQILKLILFLGMHGLL